MAKPTKLKLNRDYVLSTKLGYRIAFKKGEPTHVPPLAYNDAIAIGAEPVDGSSPEVLGEEEKAPTPLTPDERAAKIVAIIEEITTRNQREEFTAGGVPHKDTVSKAFGAPVGQKEISTLVSKMNEERQAAA